jgi:glycerol-3-phosphate dehydrogenase
LDRPALAPGCALALQDPLDPHASALFATSLGPRLLLGTGYAAPLDGEPPHAVAARELGAFLATANRRLPGLHLRDSDVLAVYAGLLPANAPRSIVPRDRTAFRDHGASGGPRGLFTISGVKFTTAHAAARHAVERIARSGLWPAAGLVRDHEIARRETGAEDPVRHLESLADVDDPRTRATLEKIVREEAVEHLDDLVLRRTALGDDPPRALAVAPALCDLNATWSGRRESELERLHAGLGARGSTPRAAAR